MQFVISALSDADVFLLITDVFEDIELQPEYVEKLRKTKTPVLLLINKVDAATQEKVAQKAEEWRAKLPNAQILAISALEKFNLDQVMNKIIELLPPGEPFYDKDQLTDKPERFFVSEIIRDGGMELHGDAQLRQPQAQPL